MDRQQISAIVATISVVTLLFIGSNPASAQVSFRDLDVSTLEYPSPGYYLIAPNAMDSFSVADNYGKNMYKTEVGQHANVQTYKNKWLTHYTTADNRPCFVRRDIFRNLIDTLRASAPFQTDFHECKIITDSSFVVLGTEDVIVDMSAIVPGGRTNAQVRDNIIQIRTFSGTTLFEWRSLDHVPVTDAVDAIDLQQPFIDYIHINSIEVDSDNNLIVSCRHLDEVIKINRQNGSIMWRLGGTKSKHNEFTFLNDTTAGFVGFSHQHSVGRTRSGTLLMFDNGNLKPEPLLTRAVEYELDETAKTVRRVWQFRATPDIYAPTMGSAQEVENGNILIGWGSGSNNTVAHEVGRDGTVHVQIDNPTMNGFTAYRVVKTTILMTGVYKSLAAIGTTTFSTSDSTTHLAVNLSRVTDTTSATAERHMYAPHNITFPTAGPCAVLPMRWVFRIEDTTLIAGTMAFDLGNVPGVMFPNQVKLFHRVNEGIGQFNQVTTTYNASTKKLTVDRLIVGEFMVAYTPCFAPSLISPVDRATEVTSTPKLEWSEAVSTGEYQVELSNVATFANVYARFSTMRLDTTLGAIPDFTKLYWRVRPRLTVGYGPWSAVSTFTTQMGISTISTPKVVNKDTIAILPDHVFRWSTVPGATAYRVVITGAGSPIVAIDTVVPTNSFVDTGKLFPNTMYTWYVRAVNDTIVGRPSAMAFFVTSPSSPRLITPPIDATDITTSQSPFVWAEVPGAIRYVVTIRRPMDSTIVVVDSATRPPLTVAALPVAARLTWTCRAVGKYGRGADAQPTAFTTSSSTVLAPPITISPNRTGNVDTLTVQFTWNSVPDAQYYDIEVTSKPSFTAPDVTVFKLTETNWTMPTLKSGATYGWRVMGYNNTSTGNWSDTATFTTRASPSQALVPISPVSGAENVSTMGVFTYTISTRFSSYDVLVDDDPGFGTLNFRFASTTGTCAFSGLSEGTTYFWRVVGKKAGNPDEYGSVSSFTTLTSTSVSESVERTEHAVHAFFSADELQIDTDSQLRVASRATLYSVTGDVVASCHLAGSGANTMTCKGLASGTYYLVVEFEGGQNKTAVVVK